MLQEKLGNYEYSYDPNEWLNLEKDLPKGKSPLGLSNKLFRLFIISSALIIPAFLILYFTDAFDSDRSENTSVTNTEIADNNNSTDITSEDIHTNSSENNNNNSNSVATSSDINSSDANDNKNNQTENNDKVNESSSQNNTADTKNDVSEKNDITQTNTNNNKLSGALITSDIVEGCAPLKVRFSPILSLGNITYSWDFGDGKTSTKASPSHTYKKAGNYTVTLTVKLPDNKTSKKIVYDKTIEVKSAPSADFSYTKNTETDEYSFTDNSINSFSWSWNFGDNSSSDNKDAQHIYKLDGNYNVNLIVTNTYGCSDTLSKMIAVKMLELFYCPTGFTPNGDGMNDYFGPVGDRMNPDDYAMNIYDQSGILVFETTDLDVLWDGNNSKTNAEAVQGMYYWKIKMKDKNNAVKETTGYLTLMR